VRTRRQSGTKARVVLDTHSGSLDGIVLEQAMSLRAPSGADIAPAAVEQVTGGGHHRQAVVVCPAAAGATSELGAGQPAGGECPTA